MIKYEVPNQLTGIAESAATWEDAKILSEKLKAEYLAYLGNIFTITVLIENEDGTWTQALADAEGMPIPDWIPE
jgi:hypothetical protein